MVKSPTRRYTTVAELADDLRRFARRTMPGPTGRRASSAGWLWAVGNPHLALASGAAAALLLAVVVVSVAFAVRERQNSVQLVNHADVL